MLNQIGIEGILELFVIFLWPSLSSFDVVVGHIVLLWGHCHLGAPAP